MTSTFAPRRQRVLPPRTGSRLVTVPEELAHLGARQHGVLHRDQLRSRGLGLTHVRAAVAAKRWQLVGRRVVVMHNAGLTQRQREWTAVLLPGKPAALAGLSAAAAGGLLGFESDDVHIVVAHNTHTRIPEWVRIHESRRFTPADIHRGDEPPRTSLARSVIDAATWSTSPRRACAILCASVQQRLTSPERLDVELRRAGAIRHAAIMRQILGDISGGGHTLAEIDLTALARRAGLPPPRRQVLRREPSGKARYVDAEVDLPDGTVLAVEVDGAVHLQPTSWWDDTARQNELTIGGHPVLRFPTPVIRLDPDTVVDQLRRIKAAHTPC
ncbi:MAG TPA: DUF559 domain-containing protein [Jatrophihabitantaceae bacterium]